MNIEQALRDIEHKRELIAKQRDDLNDLIVELTMLKDSCTTAYDCLWDAHDALSELV